MLQKWINVPSTSAVRASYSKKATTRRYILRQANDEFAVKAREHDYRARSAFKLLEIENKFKFLKNDSVVIDVGCAPGSWTQVLTEKCSSGYVLGVDVQNVLPIKGAEILSNSDITSHATQNLIQQKLEGRRVDAVLSDMAPNPTGDNATDHLRLIELCRTVFHLFSEQKLFQTSQGFVFLCKIWDGSSRGDFFDELSRRFSVVKTVKPTACRDNSAELVLNRNKMPWRSAVKVALAAGEALAKALTRAVKEEIKQTQQAAARHAVNTGQSASETQENANANAKLGISLEESLQILNVKPPLNREQVDKHYEHLFSNNDKAKGGSFYLQSKIYRAKERIDEELTRIDQKTEKAAEENEKK